MKRSLFILATLAMSSALYAQAETGNYTREKVLEIFSQYNPAVLENARQNADYNAILESFLAAYTSPQTEQNRYELIAVARNFDNSIRLQYATSVYEEAFVFSRMSGANLAPAALRFRKELFPLFENIWAVTVQLREYELQEVQAQLKALRKDKTLSDEERAEKENALRLRQAALQRESAALQENIGEQIIASVDAYIAQADQSLSEQLQAVRAAQAQAEAEQPLQTPNLQIKTKNKKPVAK